MIKLAKYLKRYIPLILIILVLVAIQAFSELALPSIMKVIVDEGIKNSDFNLIVKQSLLMLGIALLATIAVIVMNYISSVVAMKFGAKLRSEVFKKVESFSIDEMSQIGTSSLITRTTNDINQIQQVVHMVLRMVLLSPFIFIGGIVFASGINKSFMIILLIAVPIIVVVIVVLGLVVMPIFKKYQKNTDYLTLVARENLTGTRVIRAFDQEERETKKFFDANVKITKLSVVGNRIMSGFMPAVTLIMNLTIVAVAWVGSNQVNQGAIEVGSVMAVIQYAMQIMFSLVMFAMVFVMVPRASASAVRVNEVLGITPTITHAPKGEDENQTITEDGVHGELVFENVSFTFKGAELPTLENISFTSKAGETTAIIGSTGSGKSTIINLIPRFFDIDEKEDSAIKVNGVDVRDMDVHALRNMIGFVPQKSTLFRGTIAENIRFGKQDATDEEIAHATKIAQAGHFVESLEDKYDSFVAQGGTNFSGGQKQRLCIARALVRKPEIYVFDDSFSALDFKTDKSLRKALKGETKKSTVIIVAQRVSTIMDADQIIVLEEGRVVGKGTHKELMKNNDVYREIALSQLEEEQL